MKKLKQLIKSNKLLYKLYYIFVSCFINILKLFVKTDEKLILFVCYGGLHYSDSPRVIYEKMCHDVRFEGYKLVWAFTDITKHSDKLKKIKIDTFEYFKTALKARCWITNVMVERALKFKGKKTFYFYTGHGTPLKFVGNDAKEKSFLTANKFQYDCSVCQSEYDKNLLCNAFNLLPDMVNIAGVPRNDIYNAYSEEYKFLIREKLGINKGKKAILYAPTFRDIDGDKKETFEINVETWKKQLGEEYVLLYRAHPNIYSEERKDDEFFISVTKYESVEELMIASDILISDYSSIIFDYSIMHKPIFLYTYDYDLYEKTRGLYFDIRKELPFATTETELLELVKKDANRDALWKPTIIEFQKKYATVHGNATLKCLDIIYENITNKATALRTE